MMLRILAWAFFLLLTLAFVFSILLTGPINRDNSIVQLNPPINPDTAMNFKQKKTSVAGKLKSGWSRKNLMPAYITPMAGYRLRPAYEEVRDSLFVHCLLLEAGERRIAFLSYDLLIVPPALAEKVEERKEALQVDFVYFSASHTHSGIGSWEESVGGQALAGAYHDDVLNNLLLATENSIKEATNNILGSEITYFHSDGNELVQNRLGGQFQRDGRVSNLEIERVDGSSAIFTSYSAHATNIPSRGLAISNDYPGTLIIKLEKDTYDFALFMAGTVGSHAVNHPLDTMDDRFNFIDIYANALVDVIKSNGKKEYLGDSVSISYGEIPISFSLSQLRVSENLRLRNPVFNFLFAPINVNIKYLQINDVIMLGMPCDFSGEIVIENELYAYAEDRGKQLIITSFNGGYLGYITADHHYETTKRGEIREMNWVGPYHGMYFSKIVKELVDR